MRQMPRKDLVGLNRAQIIYGINVIFNTKCEMKRAVASNFWQHMGCSFLDFYAGYGDEPIPVIIWSDEIA